MKLSRTKHFSLLLLFSIALFTGCKKDDPEPDNTSNETQNESDGNMTSLINGNEFSSNQPTARYRSTDEFTIKAQNQNQEEIFIIIEDFVGQATYTFGTGSDNTAYYSNVVNGQFNNFSTQQGGNGSLTVNSYSETEKKLSGTFNFNAGGSSSNFSSIEEGSFSDVPIMSLNPAEGDAAYYLYDEFYEIADVEITKTAHFKWKYVFTPEGENAPQIVKYGDLRRGGSLFSNTVSDVDVNEEEEHCSGTFKVTNTDFEIAFNKIPYSKPVPSDPGVLTFSSPEGNIIFDEVLITFEFEPFQVNHYIVEATNSANNRLYIEAEKPHLQFPDLPPYSGFSATLEFYENVNDNTPSLVSTGKYDTQPADGDFITFGYDNMEDDSFQVQAFEVPYIYIP